MKKHHNIPKDGFEGLKQNFSSDAVSGFLVFLLALPLSLGIAGASDFTPIYGLITAMIGGLFVSFIAGSPLTIKGPAAGLIVIVAGAVAELGKGDNDLGWKLALGAVVVAGVIQVLFGILKLGSLADFFPLSAVHGMLAAIGIIIISKQLHILLGFNPVTPEGKPMVEPLELLMELKNTFANFFKHKDVVIVGLVSLGIVFGWPMIPIKAVKKIPSALVVLIVAIPLAMFLHVENIPDVKDAAGAVITKGYQPLLNFKKGLIDIIGVKVSFDGFSNTFVFIKFIIMFALVGSLEALLTVKAIDMLDPYKRKSNSNKDLIAVGIGNIVAGTLGGLPMISEVARSSANVSNGGKTRWANFFHGFYILLFLLFAVSFSDLIPKAALAAMLIGVGWKLAHPKEFGHMAKIGADNIAVFVVTIIFTLSTDLLIGIGAGILLKLILHIARGVTLSSLFNAKTKVEGNVVRVEGAAVFSNFIKVKNQILKFPYTDDVVFDVRKCVLVDHTVIETLHHLKIDFENEGGHLTILGLDEFKNAHGSKHHLSTKRKHHK
ncbi:MAG: SulP family inorganic anion transporter [Crocinitomicaceae bacterium]|nr:SulP family inorganic anion transporter [Crocinitomicaceae bacterium]